MLPTVSPYSSWCEATRGSGRQQPGRMSWELELEQGREPEQGREHEREREGAARQSYWMFEVLCVYLY